MLEAHIDGLDPEDEVRWVVDGELAEARTNLAASEVLTLGVTPGTWTYARVEVYTKAGQAKMFSNPIFLSTLSPDVPPLRRPQP